MLVSTPPAPKDLACQVAPESMDMNTPFEVAAQTLLEFITSTVISIGKPPIVEGAGGEVIRMSI